MREHIINALVDAGFDRTEAHSLVSTWNLTIYPEHLELLGAIARGICQDVLEGAALTSETTHRAFLAVREGFEEER